MFNKKVKFYFDESLNLKKNGCIMDSDLRKIIVECFLN